MVTISTEYTCSLTKSKQCHLSKKAPEEKAQVSVFQTEILTPEYDLIMEN